MLRARLPRPSRPILLTILITALLAFPMGIVLANHGFDDVPNSNPFHGDIDALVDNGVTAGCGSGNYCPKANVTREQMAAFMNRLGALGPGKDPVVDADKLDGLDSSALLPGGSPPSGTTLRGVYALSTPDNIAYGSINFEAVLPAAPDTHWLAAASSSTTDCPGTVADPEAAPGHLCIYESNAFNIGIRLIETSTRWGAVLFIDQSAFGSSTHSYGTWSVTVP
ncbi:MAG: S-layer homology domain-containing protein [Candidatus Limnocylindria bacterium]